MSFEKWKHCLHKNKLRLDFYVSWCRSQVKMIFVVLLCMCLHPHQVVVLLKCSVTLYVYIYTLTTAGIDLLRKASPQIPNSIPNVVWHNCQHARCRCKLRRNITNKVPKTRKFLLHDMRVFKTVIQVLLYFRALTFC